MNMKITGTTRLIGLLGTPVSHSISPLMHNAAFLQLNLDYAYLCFDTADVCLKDAVNGMRALNARGFNCTMPNKKEVCELCDALSPAAKMIGAVNTVVNENGILTGYNTDGNGYMRAVKDAGIDVIGKTMTLFGAGGASTAIAIQAALDGVSKLNIFARKSSSWQNAVTLTDLINRETSCLASLYDLADVTTLQTVLDESTLLTNGTSVGMKNEEDCILPASISLPQHLAVSDVIYKPRETTLMKAAAKAGCFTFNGLYMLLYQGAEAFSLWTGHEMPVDTIKRQFFSEV